MAQFETYYDPQAGRLLPVLYDWDTLTGINTWDTDYTWQDWLGGGISSTPGTPDITFRTEIIDFGRIADINPLCSVTAVGTVNIKVYVADQIDSSSLLPGDPEIEGGQSQTLSGVRGRYFQFQVDVEGTNPSISRVVTSLKGTKQVEYIQGDSATHAGTQDERIAPITQEYSLVTSLHGTALYTDSGIDSAGATGSPYVDLGYVFDGYTVSTTGDASEIPVVVVRSLADKANPKYAVFTTNGTNRDHYVYLQVSGLPKLVSNASGNIVEA